MTIRPILCLPDPRLRQVSEPVGAVDDNVRRLADDMLQTMYDAPGIGLAAIQIGVARRIVVVDCAQREDEAGEPEPMVFINPQIVWTSEELRAHEEGCLSIPEYFETVERPAECGIRFVDREGQARELHATGLLATCVQHEIDHLNGVLFIDHLSRLKRDRVTRRFQKAAKEKAREGA